VITFKNLEHIDRYDDFVGNVNEYKYLVGKIHSELVRNVYVHKKSKFIVGERALVLKDGSIFKGEFDPIHVKDLATLTKRYEKGRIKVNKLKCKLTHFDEYENKKHCLTHSPIEYICQ